MSGQDVISKLQLLGYELFLRGNYIHYKFKGRGTLPESEVRALLDYIKSNKSEISQYLKDTPKPYIRNGILHIPFDSPSRFHWWNRGQSVLDTLKELKASEEIIKKYRFYSN